MPAEYNVIIIKLFAQNNMDVGYNEQSAACFVVYYDNHVQLNVTVVYFIGVFYLVFEIFEAKAIASLPRYVYSICVKNVTSPT